MNRKIFCKSGPCKNKPNFAEKPKLKYVYQYIDGAYAEPMCTGSIEYLTTERELVLPTFKSCALYKIIEYLTLGLLSSLWNIYRNTKACFLTHPVYL